MIENDSRKVLLWTAFITVVLAFVGATVFGIYAKHKQVTTYTANRSMLISHRVNTNDSNDNKSNNNEVQNDINMMSTYKSLVNDYKVAKLTHQQLPKNLRKRYTVADIQDVIGSSVNEQSVLLKITAKTSSAKDSTVIVNTASKVFVQQLKQLKPDAGNITLLSKANVNDASAQTHPHLKKYVAVGFILGGLIGLVGSIVCFSIIDLR